MLLVKLVLVLSAVVQDPTRQPVRLWLSTPAELTPGATVRVSAEVAVPGYLVVLERLPSGRTEVLYPPGPGAPCDVSRGMYEIRSAGGGESGVGMVLAALSPDRPRFDEFAYAGAWNGDALSDTYLEPEAGLTEIVQRMLGDGSFNYDFATYSIAPAPSAPIGAIPTIGYAEPMLVEPVFIEPAFVEPVFVPEQLHHRHQHTRLRKLDSTPALAAYERGKPAVAPSTPRLPPITIVQRRSRRVAEEVPAPSVSVASPTMPNGGVPAGRALLHARGVVRSDVPSTPAAVPAAGVYVGAGRAPAAPVAGFAGGRAGTFAAPIARPVIGAARRR